MLVKIFVLSVLLVVFNIVKDRNCVYKYNPNSVIHQSDASVLDSKKEYDRLASYLNIKGEYDSKAMMSDLDFSSLGKTKKSREKKMVGWITIPGIIVDYPIMYSKDNNYYLSHTNKGESSKSGAIFLDQSSGGFWHRINLIHGHNMMVGSMFGELSKYKYEDWGKKHKYMYVTEDDGYIRQFKIFSVYCINGNTEQIKIRCSDTKDYEKYLAKMYNRSMYSFDKPTSKSQIVILNTCSYAFNGEHFIVCAYTDDESNISE